MEPVILDGLIPMGLVQSPLGVVMFDAELRVVWVNEAAVRLSGGTPAGRWPGRRLGEVLPCMDADVIERSLRRVLATGEPVVGLEVSSRVDDCGAERFWNSCLFRIDGPDGETAGLACMMREVTEQAQNQHRLALVDEASARIGTTLDITRTAEELLDVALARLADAGAVDLLATVIEGDQHAPHAHDQKMHLRRGCLPGPAGPPAPPATPPPRWGGDPPAHAQPPHPGAAAPARRAPVRGARPAGYLPAQTGPETGGAWSDFTPLREARCALTSGAVTGHDTRAAPLMGQPRPAPRPPAPPAPARADIPTRLDQITADLTDDE